MTTDLKRNTLYAKNESSSYHKLHHFRMILWRAECAASQGTSGHLPLDTPSNEEKSPQ